MAIAFYCSYHGLSSAKVDYVVASPSSIGAGGAEAVGLYEDK